jgi:hypothetical protein
MTRASRAKIIERLATIGVSDRLREPIMALMRKLLRDIGVRQHDDKQRHFVLLVFTAEAGDAEGINVATDVYSSLDPRVGLDFTHDWVEQAKAARKAAGL